LRAGVEGVPENLRPIPSALAAADGRLWFATTGGLFSIDPRHVAHNPVPPQVQVLTVVAAGTEHSAAAAVGLPASTRTLQVDFTATSLAAPELVRFRYRLDGVDQAWQDGGSRRQAFYTNLQPGRCAFRVLAANEDGLWSSEAAVVAIAIPAAFWQTRWCEGACAPALPA
jgi:hypothetical protein